MKKIYIFNLFLFCFIADSTNEFDIKHWNVLKNGGQKWKVETDCPGSGALPYQLLGLSGGKRTNFATSHAWCEREQVIDLIREGIPEKVLDDLRPPIFVSEW